eukprot:3855515-Pyramimonas_sp.AAC.1
MPPPPFPCGGGRPRGGTGRPAFAPKIARRGSRGPEGPLEGARRPPPFTTSDCSSPSVGGQGDG